MDKFDRNGGKVMRRTLLPLAIVTVLACVAAATGLAAGSTQITQFSFTTPRHQLCGIWGTAVVHGTSVFRDTGNGTYFMSGTFFGVFTADNGKTTTLVGAGPVKQTSRHSLLRYCHFTWRRTMSIAQLESRTSTHSATADADLLQRLRNGLTVKYTG